MNERIRELAEQAREYVADAIELGFPQDQVDDIRDEKFAELIVRECSGILRKEANSNWEGREERLLNAMANWIEEHFGLKNE